MSELPPKVTALFGTYTPSAGTLDVLMARADNAAAALRERKMVAFAAIAIDEEGQAHLFHGHEPLKSTLLVGGLEVLKHILVTGIANEELYDDTPPPKGSSDDPA